MNWELIIRVVLEFTILVVGGLCGYFFGLRKGFKIGVDLMLKKVQEALKNSPDI